MSELKIICSHCKRSFTIPEEDKPEWDCPRCGMGHAMSAGIAMPKNYSDEFALRKRSSNPIAN